MNYTFTFPAKTKDEFQSNIETLTKNLNDISKQISFFDVYNITDAVTDKEQCAAQISALKKNSSLVINVPPFSLNGEYYNTGDIILKTDKEQVLHIKAQTGGIYYPASISKGDDNTYQIRFNYSGSTPADNSMASFEVDTQVATAPSSSMTFTGLTASANNNYVYGLWRPFEDGKFDAFFKDDDLAVRPYIKFYFFHDNLNPEEVFLDYDLTLDDKKWYIGVDSEIDTNKLYIKVK